MKVLLLLVLLLVAIIGYAQGTLGAPANGIDMTPAPYGIISAFNLKGSEVEGTVYLENDWRQAHIKMFNGAEIDDYPIKVDLENNIIEIRINDQTKVLTASKVKSFALMNSETGGFDQYVNCSDYTDKETVLIGFFKVVEKGLWSLFELKYIENKEVHYIPTLDMGDDAFKIQTKSKLYLFGNNELVEMPKSKKHFLKYFDEFDGLKDFMKDNSVRINNSNEVGIALAFINSKIK